MSSVIVLEVLLFNFNLDNKTQNVKTKVVRKLFNENGIGMFLSKNSKHYRWVYFVTRLSAETNVEVAMKHVAQRKVTCLGKKKKKKSRPVSSREST